MVDTQSMKEQQYLKIIFTILKILTILTFQVPRLHPARWLVEAFAKSWWTEEQGCPCVQVTMMILDFCYHFKLLQCMRYICPHESVLVNFSISVLENFT